MIKKDIITRLQPLLEEMHLTTVSIGAPPTRSAVQEIIVNITANENMSKGLGLQVLAHNR